jgi:hypothetical protein
VGEWTPAYQSKLHPLPYDQSPGARGLGTGPLKKNRQGLEALRFYATMAANSSNGLRPVRRRRCFSRQPGAPSKAPSEMPRSPVRTSPTAHGTCEKGTHPHCSC